MEYFLTINGERAGPLSQFQVIERNGKPEPFPSWKDVVNVRRQETVRFVVRFDDFAGKWMFHCHILTHEDMGMMGILEVK